MSVEIEAGAPDAASVRVGTVLAVCYSKKLINKVQKESQESGEITQWGIPGDVHYGETRWSASAHRRVANNRPITVVGREAAQGVCAALGIPEVPVGGLGENLLLEGLGDLSELREGDQLRVLAMSGAPVVVLEVRKQNEPCSNLLVYDRLMPREMFGKRGVICTVLQEGTVRPGDHVEIVTAQ